MVTGLINQLRLTNGAPPCRNHCKNGKKSRKGFMNFHLWDQLLKSKQARHCNMSWKLRSLKDPNDVGVYPLVNVYKKLWKITFL